jgi:uncharacterized protein (TIGR03435 family)
MGIGRRKVRAYQIIGPAMVSILAIASARSALSQTEPAAASTAKFEVASIKQSKSFDMRRIKMGVMDRPDDGRFYATNVTAKLLIRLAYDVQDSQIVGGPDWIDSERFNIQAKADSATDAELKKLNPLEAKLVKEHMLQDLLADRFKLKLSHETKQLPVYALEVAKNGPKLEETKGVAAGPAVGEGSERPGQVRPGPDQAGVRMRSNGGEQQVDFEDSPVSMLVRVLSQSLGRTVVDKTGLTGRYNFKLHWASDMGRMLMGGPGPGGPGQMPGGNAGPSTGTALPPTPSGPSIFTAIQEQLGLKLKPEKGPVPILVINQIEPPSAD